MNNSKNTIENSKSVLNLNILENNSIYHGKPVKEIKFHRSISDSIGNNYSPYAQNLNIKNLKQLSNVFIIFLLYLLSFHFFVIKTKV